MRRSALVLTSLAAAALAQGATATEARANGRFPASNGVIFAPGDDDTILVRVTFGLLVTHDRGRSWRWICERAIGFSGPEDPSYVITKSGAIVAGLFEGIRVSRDGGCTWESVTTDAKVFVDLTTRADGAVLALASSYDHPGDAGSLFESRVWLSTDDARTFVPFGPRIDPTLLGETVEVAPSDPRRVYVSAVRDLSGLRDHDVREGVLLVSDDGATRWTERPTKLEGSDLAPFIAAVDPRRADRVYIRTSSSPEQPTRLLVTNDAGRSYEKLLSARGPLRGFALSEDGARIHAGGPEDGLFAGAPGAGELVRTSPLAVQCLAQRGDTLWACAGEASGFVAGVARVSGDREAGVATAFEARLHLRDIGGPIACGGGTSVGKECETDWRKLQRELGLGEAAPDAGPRPRLATRTEPARPGRRALWVGVLVALIAAAVLVVRGRRRDP
jgi:hypothetical protein